VGLSFFSLFSLLRFDCYPVGIGAHLWAEITQIVHIRGQMRIDFFKMKLWRETYGVESSASPIVSPLSFKEYYHWGRYKRKKKENDEAPLPDPKWDKAMSMLDSLPKWKGA